jgi:hypothetical protein
MVSNRPPVLNPDPNLLQGNRNDPLKDRRQPDVSKIGGLSHEGGPGTRFSARVNVYVLRAKMKNTSSKPIARFVWAYQLPDSSPNATDAAYEEYLCNVRIEPGETKTVKVTSPIPRSKTIDVSAASTPPTPHEPTLKDMIINQIQFADNDKWQRPDWNSVVLSRQGARKLGEGKCIAL